MLNYPSDEACIADGQRLAGLMTHKHDLYGTGFAGGKIVAETAEPDAVKDELISVTAELLESLDGAMITGCDLNTSLEDMERLTALTPHVLAAVGSPVDASAATAHGTLGAVEAVLDKDLNDAHPAGPSCTAAVPLVAPLPAISSSTVGPCSPWIWTRESQFSRRNAAAEELRLVGTEPRPSALLDLRIDQRRNGDGAKNPRRGACRQCPLPTTPIGG